MGIFLILVFIIFIIVSLDILSNLIILLIILEILILMIFLLTNLFLFLRKLSIFFIFITLSVAEATIGLSLLTILVRRHGNDYIKINIFLNNHLKNCFENNYKK